MTTTRSWLPTADKDADADRGTGEDLDVSLWVSMLLALPAWSR